jgi:catechol 2,3-dioxygenase-like lactoylglutathione lyase family enzyme
MDGFGWRSVFENEEIVFYQMNGFVLGTWLAERLAEDLRRPISVPSGFALAHNVGSRDAVGELIQRLAGFGGAIIREGDEPPHGGFRGHVADPDGYAWEIAWNPDWPISPEGYVTFGVPPLGQ